MLNPNKEAERLDNNTVQLAQCPICASYTTLMYYMQDAKTKVKTKWYHCHCGVVWQHDPKEVVYDGNYYRRHYEGGKKWQDTSEYPVRVYAPIIEEAVYGRKALVIGLQDPYQADLLRHRGWVTFTCDRNTGLSPSDRHFACDFETHTFDPDLRFNLIWLYQTFECFANPKQSLTKCYQLLAEDGILVVMTPNADFIHLRSPAGFQHWKRDNKFLWNPKALGAYLERLGFLTIMCRSNMEPRFPVQDDFHAIYQKKYF